MKKNTDKYKDKLKIVIFNAFLVLYFIYSYQNDNKKKSLTTIKLIINLQLFKYINEELEERKTIQSELLIKMKDYLDDVNNDDLKYEDLKERKTIQSELLTKMKDYLADVIIRLRKNFFYKYNDISDNNYYQISIKNIILFLTNDIYWKIKLNIQIMNDFYENKNIFIYDFKNIYSKEYLTKTCLKIISYTFLLINKILKQETLIDDDKKFLRSMIDLIIRSEKNISLNYSDKYDITHKYYTYINNYNTPEADYSNNANSEFKHILTQLKEELEDIESYIKGYIQMHTSRAFSTNMIERGYLPPLGYQPPFNWHHGQTQREFEVLQKIKRWAV